MLTVRRFHSRYHVPSGTPNTDVLRARLDRVVRERIPALVSRGFPIESGDEGAIVIIRRLHLNLWLDALTLDEPDVAERWAKLLVQATVQAIWRGSSDNVLRFENRADFLAAFITDLLAGRAWSHWAYETYRPMEGLTDGRAAAFAMAEQPEALPEVAQRLERAGRLDSLLDVLNADDLALVWDRGLGFDDVEARRLPEDLAELLSSVRLGLRLETGTAGGFARNRLRAYLLLAGARRASAPDEGLAVVAHRVARLHELMAARPAPLVWRTLARGEIASPSALAGFIGSLPTELRGRTAWLLEELSRTDGARRLAALTRLLVSESDTTPAPPQAGRRATTQPSVTSFAGLALLLPVLRQSGLYEAAGREAVYQLLLDTVPQAFRPLAWGDPGPALLAGINAETAQLARADTVEWPDFAGGDSSSEPDYRPSTLAILRRFAAGLRRFEASSPAYIGRQFLTLPGEIEFSDDAMEVTLYRSPLGVVLQIAGYIGEQGRIPWLNQRMLVINLPRS